MGHTKENHSRGIGSQNWQNRYTKKKEKRQEKKGGKNQQWRLSLSTSALSPTYFYLHPWSSPSNLIYHNDFRANGRGGRLARFFFIRFGIFHFRSRMAHSANLAYYTNKS